MRILNLYAGIGGNRKLWDSRHEIIAVEINPDIATIYKDLFPLDNVVVGDAHQYLLDHFAEFDFIWSSPPCPTHSKTRFMQTKKIYIDMTLWQEIIFLKTWFGGGFCVENVIPYYNPLVAPSAEIERHLFWSNFNIAPFVNKDRLKTCKMIGEREVLQEKFGIDIDRYTGVDKRRLLRNCVVPEIGLHIIDCYSGNISASNQKYQSSLFDMIGEQ